MVLEVVAAVPDAVIMTLLLMSGCIAGVEFAENMKAMMQNAGFEDIKMIPKDNSREILKSWAPDKNLEDFVASFIIEAIKK